MFGDRNSSHIHIKPFQQESGNTIVTWFNKSLTTVKCPHDEIHRLTSLLVHYGTVSNRVQSIMERDPPQFPISAVQVLTLGNCQTSKNKPPVNKPDDNGNMAPIDKTKGVQPGAEHDEFQYLMTFIVPAVIISVMLFVAAVAACVLYRRRRTGKMNVEEDGRQSYGNKGIPVIFQVIIDPIQKFLGGFGNY